MTQAFTFLVHLLDQCIDVLLPVAQISTLNEVLELPCLPPAVRVAQLERPEETVRLLEVGSDGEDLMDQVLHTHDAVLAKVVLDQLVVSERDALLVDLAVATLVDKFTDGLERGVAVGYVWLDNLKEFGGGLGQADEDT